MPLSLKNNRILTIFFTLGLLSLIASFVIYPCLAPMFIMVCAIVLTNIASTYSVLPAYSYITNTTWLKRLKYNNVNFIYMISFIILILSFILNNIFQGICQAEMGDAVTSSNFREIDNFLYYQLFIIYAMIFVFQFINYRISNSKVSSSESISKFNMFCRIFQFLLCLVISSNVMARLFSPSENISISSIYFISYFIVLIFAVLAIICNGLSESSNNNFCSIRNELAKSIIGYSTFWVFIFFSSSLIIWYGNSVSDVFLANYYKSYNLMFVYLTVIILKFFLPFVLLIRKSGRNRLLLSSALLIIVGSTIELDYLFLPQHSINNLFAITFISFQLLLPVVFFIRWNWKIKLID